jgi:hypothetical protein
MGNLVSCPDCSREVSAMAVSCPQCGRPMAATVIEKTGKTYKQRQLIAGLLMIIGVIFIIIGIGSESSGTSVFGALLMAVGLITYLTARVGAWWKHG